MTRYFKRNFSDNIPVLFAIAEGTTGVPDNTEWRLDGKLWIELPNRPVFGWMVNGETGLDDIDASEVPSHLSEASIVSPSVTFS